jgi:hypothetical protein
VAFGGGDDNMKKLSQCTIKELERLPKRKKIKVYAGGEIRERTVGWLLKQKREANKKKKARR